MKSDAGKMRKSGAGCSNHSHGKVIAMCAINAGEKPPSLVEWVRSLEALGIDAFHLAPHHVQLLEFLEEFVSCDPPRRLIINMPPSRRPLRPQD